MLNSATCIVVHNQCISCEMYTVTVFIVPIIKILYMCRKLNKDLSEYEKHFSEGLTWLLSKISII